MFTATAALAVQARGGVMALVEIPLEQAPRPAPARTWGAAAYAAQGETPAVDALFRKSLGVFQARMGAAPAPDAQIARDMR